MAASGSIATTRSTRSSTKDSSGAGPAGIRLEINDEDAPLAQRCELRSLVETLGRVAEKIRNDRPEEVVGPWNGLEVEVAVEVVWGHLGDDRETDGSGRSAQQRPCVAWPRTGSPWARLRRLGATGRYMSRTPARS